MIKAKAAIANSVVNLADSAAPKKIAININQPFASVFHQRVRA
jgi:hypothetical protein